MNRETPNPLLRRVVERLRHRGTHHVQLQLRGKVRERPECGRAAGIERPFAENNLRRNQEPPNRCSK